MYRTILVDPPWHEHGGCGKGANAQYPTLRDREVLPTIQACELFLPDPDQCHLWLWVTRNRLPLGLSIMADLGFRYITNATWVKAQPGLGQYLRGRHELVLLGTMGKAHLPVKAPDSVIHAPRTRHSAKPVEFYQMFEAVSAPPRLELFARGRCEGWDAWGNEVDNE